jgi:methylglutaconyl-CoA hydratase
MDDPEVRAILLTATGPVFCAGGDLKEQRMKDAPAQDEPSFADVLATVMNGPTPVVVKMNGPAREGGLGLVAASDIAVAPTSASFAFSEVRIGVAPAMIAVPCTRRMSARSVSRYFLTGETFDAVTAAEIGLVTMAVDDVDAACDALVAALRLAGPNALRAAKQLISDASTLEISEALATMERESRRLFASEEAREGMLAFLEKRPPAWAASNNGGTHSAGASSSRG